MSVEYARAGLARSPSGTIWADCPIMSFIKDPGKGVHLWEDFVGNFTANAVEQVGPQGLLVVGTNSDTAIVTDEETVVNISGSGAGNDEAYLVSNLLCNEAIKKDSGRRVWFEARVKMDDTSADVTFLCGLGESSLLAADALADEGVSRNNIADYDFIGFHTDNDGTNQGDMETCYHQDGDGGALTAVQATVRAFGATTTYDDTYMKLGFKFDGNQTVTFYLDGAKLATTLDIDDLTSDKLDAALGIIIGIKDLAGGNDDLKIDWVRFACDNYDQGVNG
jgi:hypothetical protein